MDGTEATPIDADSARNVRAWLRGWWVAFRYGSVFTKDGRALRRAMKDNDPANWVEVPRP